MEANLCPNGSYCGVDAYETGSVAVSFLKILNVLLMLSKNNMEYIRQVHLFGFSLHI